MEEKKGEIIIYESEESQQGIEVKFEKDTVWLTQKQIATVFGTKIPAINKHISNILSEGELQENPTISKMEIVQKEGKRVVSRQIDIYNLDMIISIGYRVNSQKATRFRQWATQRLKDFLVKGYAINEKRLQQVSENLKQLQSAIQLIEKTGKSEELNLTEAIGLLEIISNYTQSFVLLSQFDSNNLIAGQLKANITYEIKYDEAIAA